MGRGLDAVTMLFASPFEDDIEWKLIAGDPNDDREPITGWVACSRRCRMRSDASGRGADELWCELTHRAIERRHEDLERLRFNVAISKLMVLTNEMRAALDAGGAARGAAEALVLMLAPFAPFAAEELWRDVLGHSDSVHVSGGPSFDEALAARGHRHVDRAGRRKGPRQDRGARRCRRSPRALELAHASENVRRAIGDREVVKEIVRAPSS